jgi:hypothetical protein
MTDVTVIDDVIDIASQDEIYNNIFSKDTLWTFARTVFYDKVMYPEVSDKQKNSLMTFTKALIDYNTGERDKLFDLYTRPLHNICKSDSIINCRLQLQLPLITEQNKIYGVPHVDNHMNRKFKVGVYYTNDVDGDTVIFKQTTKDTTPEEVKDGKLEIDKTISPKKGRLVIFDGDIYHAVGKPKTDLRCIINYNFKC